MGGDEVLTYPDYVKAPGTQFAVPVSLHVAAHERDHSLKPLIWPNLSFSRSILVKGLPKATQLATDMTEISIQASTLPVQLVCTSISQNNSKKNR